MCAPAAAAQLYFRMTCENSGPIAAAEALLLALQCKRDVQLLFMACVDVHALSKLLDPTLPLR